MATSYTYTTLKAAVVAFTEDQGTEFASAFDQILPLAEDKLLKDLDLELFDVSATSTFGISSPWVAKPSDMVALRSIHYTNADGDFVQLEPRSYEACKDYWPNSTDTTATPKYFSEWSDEEWLVAGTPNAAFVTTIRYVKRPASMTSGNPTTWLGTHTGDLLFYACLLISEQFLKADPRIAVWGQDYAARLATALRELKPQHRHSYMPMTGIPTKEQ